MYLSKGFMRDLTKEKSPMTNLGEFVYYRTYSRWLEEKGRREEWEETVERATNYNVGLAEGHYKKEGILFDRKKLVQEAEQFAKRMYNLETFLSGRTLWVGGTEVAEKFPTANFNCSFMILDDWKDYEELFYLLMVGTGAGVRILKEDVEKFLKIRTDVQIELKKYVGKDKEKREDFTSVSLSGMVATIKVGDSKEGWVKALGQYFDILTNFLYNGVKKIVVDFDYVRPKGERLKTFGGTASGYESLLNMFSKIDKVIKATEGKIRPIHALDIATIIGENVVVGGVRRTSLITLFDEEDEEVRHSKDNLYIDDGEGNLIENQAISHRRMANNSVFYRRKPEYEVILEQIKTQYYSGEPAFINEVAGKKRREDFKGVNPCGEVLLDDEQLCNLTTLNIMGFVVGNKIDKKELKMAIESVVRAGIRMTLVELELDKWNVKQKRDRIVGCSFTGWFDCVEAVGMSKKDERRLERELKRMAHNEARRYAKELEINEPLLVTTIKPEGTLSQLPTVSSGIHLSHAPYYIRRVRINRHDKLVEVAQRLGWEIKPEVGETLENCSTVVIEFPVKSPAKKTKGEVGAIEQLETYKDFMENYVDHNASITVHLRENEIEEVADWVYSNWDVVVGITFIAYDEHFYQLAPYEEISEKEYNKRVKEMKPFNKDVLLEIEKEETMIDIGDDGCEGGVCPIR